MRILAITFLLFANPAFAVIDDESSAHPHSDAAFEGATVIQPEADPEPTEKPCPFAANDEDSPLDSDGIIKVEVDPDAETIK